MEDAVWLAVDNLGERMFDDEPVMDSGGEEIWWSYGGENDIILPKGTIKKLIGFDLKWDDGSFFYNNKPYHKIEFKMNNDLSCATKCPHGKDCCVNSYSCTYECENYVGMRTDKDFIYCNFNENENRNK